MTQAPTPETVRAAARLRRHVEWSEGFWLGYVFTIAPPQAHVLQAELAQQLAGRGLVQRVLRPTTPEDLERSLTQVVEAGHSGAVWLEAIRDRSFAAGEWTRAWTYLVARANERRELVRQRLSGGLVLVAHPDVKFELRAGGPDLWSIRSLSFELSPSPVVSVRARARLMEAPPPGGSSAAQYGFHERNAQLDSRRAFQLRKQGRLSEATDATLSAIANWYASRARPAHTQIAWLLDRLAVDRAVLGQRYDAGEAAQESVLLYRSLSTRDDDVFFEVAFAAALHNFAVIGLSGIHRSIDRVVLMTEAVEILRRAADLAPLLSEPLLALALSNLGLYLALDGRVTAAIAVARDAVERARTLALRDLDRDGLEATLVNYAGLLFELGRFEEAIAHLAEAVSLLLPTRGETQRERLSELLALLEATCKEGGLTPPSDLARLLEDP
jgi:tetratricopeptide (TPR) repeat protein